MKKVIVALLMSSLALPVAAQEKTAENPDWSGFWNLGVGMGYTESPVEVGFVKEVWRAAYLSLLGDLH